MSAGVGLFRQPAIVTNRPAVFELCVYICTVVV